MITKQKDICCYSEDILKLANEGIHCSMIAKQLGIGDCALRYFLKRRSITTGVFVRKTYTEDEAIHSKTLYDSGKSCKDIAKYLGFGVKTVYAMLNSVGTNLTTRLEVNIEEVISLYNNNKLSCKSIANKLGYNEKFIHKKLVESGIEMRTRSECNIYRSGYTVNLDAFSDFTRESDSYFYGFLLADGCIVNNTVSICLNTKDRVILEKMQDYLGLNYGLSDRDVFDKRTNKVYKRSTLSFGHPLVTTRLKDQGFNPRKSTKEVLPKFDWENNRHFWRGMVDGDGHVRISKCASALVLVGSKEVINGFITFCKQTVGLITERNPSHTGEEGKLLYKVQLTGQDARNVAAYLYEGSTIHLDRKKNVALKLSR